MFFDSPEQKAGKIVFFIFLLLMIAIGILSNHFKAHAQESSTKDIESQIAQSILTEMIMCRQKSDGKIIFHQFCRENTNQCVQDAKDYARYIVRYSEEYNLDPWLPTAVAAHESNFDAYRVGSKGERTIFQLHPYSPWGKSSIFVQNRKFREQCKTINGHCQGEAVGLAIRLLRNSIDNCKSVDRALTSYNTGECSPLRNTYVESVKAKQNALKVNYKSVPWCTGEKINE
jgi:hypothetical protein